MEKTLSLGLSDMDFIDVTFVDRFNSLMDEIDSYFKKDFASSDFNLFEHSRYYTMVLTLHKLGLVSSDEFYVYFHIYGEAMDYHLLHSKGEVK